MDVPRALNPVTNPAGYLAAAGAVAAAVTMLVNAVNNHGLIDPTVIVAAVGAVGALLTRQAVTPVADPKNSAGVPLVPSVAPGPPSAVMPAEPVRPPSWPSSVQLVLPEKTEKTAGPATVPVTTLPPPPVPPEVPAP